METMKMKIDPETALPTVEKMIYDQAWKCAQAYDIPFDECKSEAYSAFLGACRDFQPDKKMKFTSWCYYWIWCKLKDLVMKKAKDPLCFIEIDDDILPAKPVHSPTLDILEDLSDDAQELVTLIVETPTELLCGVKTPLQLLTKVKKYLVSKGKRKEDVDAAHREVELVLREEWA